MILRQVNAALQRRPGAADVALAAAVAVLAVVTAVVLVAPQSPDAPPTPVIVVWAIGLTAPLVVRRRFPLTVLLITGVHFCLYWATGRVNEIASWVTLGVAIYSAAAYGRRPLAARLCIAVAVLMAAVVAALGLSAGVATPVELVALTMFNTLPFAVAWPLGAMMRSLRETRATLEERNRQLDEERRSNARRAIVEERVRIARELHDVVAHHVSVIGVQAGVARRLFDRRPEQAAEAIASVETTSRQAIVDLHQIVGFLRQDDAAAGDHTPQPDLTRLPALISQMRSAGLHVDYMVEGHQQRRPAAVELSAYRIVQEALTNVLKHAGPAHAVVRIAHRDDGIDVEVVDDGRATARGNGAPVGGKGLLGMGERANLHGGRLEAGPRPAGGFRVHATLNESAP